MNEQEKKIYDQIVGQSMPRGKVRAIDAAKALQSDEWKKWLRERERDNKAGVMPIHGFNADGEPIKAEKYNDRQVLCWLYDTYLRMSQMNQRSQYTQCVDKQTGRIANKFIIDMTFDEFLMDGLKNLDWVEKEDIPMKRKFFTESPIGVVYGISDDVAKFNLEIVKRLRESITRYLKMDEQEKLIYATDAVLFE
jgi:predicted small secreted protein